MKKRTVLCVLITAGICGAQSKRASSTAEIEAVLAQVATFEHGRDPAPTVQLDEMVGRLSGSAEMRSTVEKLLLKLIQSNATPAGKEVAFRQLSLVGSNASIPVVAPLLTEIDTAEVARFALAAIPGAAVDEALRKALTQAPSDRIRIGLINSLGRRRDTKAVPVISPMITPANLDVAAAGAAALASISDRPALAALAGVRKSATGPLRELASEASVVCADHFAARGEKAVASSVYKEMVSPAEPSPIRTRALKSFGAADPKGAVPVLVAELQSSDSERQVIGIGLLNRIPGPEVTRAMLTEFAKHLPGRPGTPSHGSLGASRCRRQADGAERDEKQSAERARRRAHRTGSIRQRLGCKDACRVGCWSRGTRTKCGPQQLVHTARGRG